MIRFADRHVGAQTIPPELAYLDDEPTRRRHDESEHDTDAPETETNKQRDDTAARQAALMKPWSVRSR